MKTAHRRLALAAGVMIVALATPGGAQECARCGDDAASACVAKSFDSGEAKCRKAISKNVGKIFKTAAKVSASCHKDRDKGKRQASDDCNDLDIADSKDKLQKTRDKFVAGIGKSCPGSLGDDVLDEYISCPEPCNTVLASSNPLDSYQDLAACLGCVVTEAVAVRNATVLGTPSAPLSSKVDAKCHAALSKSWDKYVATILKERTRCQDAAEAKEEACGLSTTTCATADEKAKIAKALGKAGDGVDKQCDAADFGQLGLTGSCAGAMDPAGYNACAKDESDSAAAALLADSYSLPAEGLCPVRIETTIHGGFGKQCTSDADCAAGETCAANLAGISRCQTSTVLDLGWTGDVHDVDVVAGYTLIADVTCPEEGRCSDDQAVACSTNGDCGDVCIQASPCGSCTIDGASAAPSSNQQLTRCEGDTAVACTDPFQLDPACNGLGSGLCGRYVSPPKPIAAALNPTCNVLRLRQDLAGTTNPDDGSTALSVDLNWKIYLGIAQNQPCPLCVGDVTVGDGTKDGTCSGGAHDGSPCDAAGFHGTFADEDDGLAVSLDCPPSDGVNISGAGLAVPMDLTTGTASLPFETNCDPPFPPPPVFVCACGVCSLDTAKPCVNNADCDLGTEGTCTTNGGGQAATRQPNGCSDLVCTDVGGDSGECTAGGIGDTISYCDGELRGSGQGYITCTDNADCTAYNAICAGGDCGECTLQKTRPCFLDPIVRTGTADPEAPVLASAFCMPSTFNNAINQTTGWPGPNRVRMQTTQVQRFD